MTPEDALRRAMALVESVHAGDPAVRPQAAQQEIERLAARFAGTEPAATSLEMFAVMVAHIDLQVRRDVPGMERLALRSETLAARLAGDEMAAKNAVTIARMHRLFVAHARGDRAGTATGIDDLVALAKGLPEDHP